MKKHYIASTAVAVMTFATYPALKEIAAAGRTYYTPGAEPLVLIFGVLIAMIILYTGWEREENQEQEEDPVIAEFDRLVKELHQAEHNFIDAEPGLEGAAAYDLLAARERLDAWYRRNPDARREIKIA